MKPEDSLVSYPLTLFWLQTLAFQETWVLALPQPTCGLETQAGFALINRKARLVLLGLSAQWFFFPFMFVIGQASEDF